MATSQAPTPFRVEITTRPPARSKRVASCSPPTTSTRRPVKTSVVVSSVGRSSHSRPCCTCAWCNGFAFFQVMRPEAASRVQAEEPLLPVTMRWEPCTTTLSAASPREARQATAPLSCRNAWSLPSLVATTTSDPTTTGDTWLDRSSGRSWIHPSPAGRGAGSRGPRGAKESGEQQAQARQPRDHAAHDH